MKVSEGTRTPDRLDHNQELYQLSYAHRGRLNLAARPRTDQPFADQKALDGEGIAAPALARRAGLFAAVGSR